VIDLGELRAVVDQRDNTRLGAVSLCRLWTRATSVQLYPKCLSSTVMHDVVLTILTEVVSRRDELCGLWRPPRRRHLPVVEVQVVGGGQRKDVSPGVPRRVQNLAVEVNVLNVDVLPRAPRRLPRDDLHLVHRATNVITGGFEADIFACRQIVHPEEIVVRTRQDLLVVVRPARIKLVKDAVVLVQITELGSEKIVDIERLDRCALLPRIPDLDRKVVP
jgi:hypothetical protein